MSYLFDADSELLYATLGTALNVGSTGITIACFLNQPTTFTQNAHVFSVSNSNSSNTGMARIQAGGTDHVWYAQHNDASFTRYAEITDDITDGTWTPIIAVYTSTSARQIYVAGVAGTDTGSSHSAADMTFVRAGVNPLGGDHLRGRLARLAIWNKALDTSERASYVAGTVTSTNLRAYWSLESDLTKTSGADSVGSLTASGATYDSDNPSFGTKYLKLLAHSSAASASSIAGVVFEAPAGGAITGARIGEFTGGTFLDNGQLEAGQAVLKVATSEFGGGSLTTSDTPVALVRNASNTTGMVSCTVIEE